MTTKQTHVLYAITYYYRNKSCDTQSLCHPISTGQWCRGDGNSGR